MFLWKKGHLTIAINIAVIPGTAAASRLFNEALAKIAVNAQQGGTTDIGE